MDKVNELCGRWEERWHLLREEWFTSERRRDCSKAVISIPERPFNSCSLVSFAKSTTAIRMGSLLSAAFTK